MSGAVRTTTMACVIGIALALLAVATTGTSAAAGPRDCNPPATVWDDELGCIQNTDYGGVIPGGDETTIPVVRARDGEPPRCYADADGQRQEVPCARDAGVWNGHCYVRHVQEPPGDFLGAQRFEAAMEGHDDGVVIGCQTLLCYDPVHVRPDGPEYPCPSYSWAPDAEPVDPAAVAEEIWARLTKAPIDIGVAPFDEPGYMGYIGVPSWYWVKDFSDLTVGPIGDSDSSHGFTVVAESEVDHIMIDVGDGTPPFECPVGSLPWEPGKDYWESPDCGHVFEEQGEYTITATSVWVESWAGLGQAGTREIELEAQTEILIGENQVLRQ